MSELGIPAKVIRLCRMTLSNSCSCVKVGNDLFKYFDIERGYRQGDLLSCDPLNFLMESVLQKESVHRNGTIFYNTTTLTSLTLTSLTLTS